MSDLSSAPISPAAIALGAEPLTVTYLDGRTESVLVPLLTEPEKDYPVFLDLVGEPDRLTEFAAKRDAGWAATLHPGSRLDFVERFIALNFPLVRRWAELRTRHLALLEGMRTVLPSASRSPKP